MTRAEPVALVASIPWGVESNAEPGVSYRPGDITPLARPIALTASGADRDTVIVGGIVKGHPTADGYRLEVVVHRDRTAGAHLLGAIAQPGFAPYLLPRIRGRQLVAASICAVETWRAAQLRRVGPIPPAPVVDLTPVPLPPEVGQWWATLR